MAQVGGKGYGLYWLAAHGFPAPPTWVLSTAAFDLAVDQMGLQTALEGVERALGRGRGNWAATRQALETLKTLRSAVVDGLRQAPLPDPVGAALAELPLEPTMWAVRSSATTEDSPRHSFAGQFLSLLAVPGGPPLWKGVRQVWASAFSERALTYCAQNRLPLPRMAVVLQPMSPITSRDRSGVALSHSPIETLPGVLIQATFGTGEVVVAGYGGDLYSVQGDQVRIQPMPPPDIRITATEGGTKPQPLPDALPLSEQEARELAELVRAVADRWGGPVDVEFVWRAGASPTLVQVRPGH